MPVISRLRGRSTTKTFVYMWIGARHMLDLAKQSQDGQLYTCVSALVLSAFMLEAYFNHLGRLQHENWDDIERKYPKLKKFKMFARNAKLKVDMSKRPYSSLVRLFAFRDTLAHGKTVTEQIDLEIEVKGSLAKSLPRSKWQEFASIETTEELFKDAVALVCVLHKATGHRGNPFGSGGGGIYTLSPSET